MNPITCAEIRQHFEKLAAQFNIDGLETEFYMLDEAIKKAIKKDASIDCTKVKTEISKNLTFKVIDFDKLKDKYCSKEGIGCGAYGSADGIFLNDQDNSITLIEIKSFKSDFDKINAIGSEQSLSDDELFRQKNEAFNSFISKYLFGDERPHKREKGKDIIYIKHPFDTKLLDSYLLLLSLLAEEFKRRGISYILNTTSKPVRFFWYLPGNPLEISTMLLASMVALKDLEQTYRDAMCYRFHSLKTFEIVTESNIEEQLLASAS